MRLSAFQLQNPTSVSNYQADIRKVQQGLRDLPLHHQVKGYSSRQKRPHQAMLDRLTRGAVSHSRRQLCVLRRASQALSAHDLAPHTPIHVSHRALTLVLA